MSVTNVIDIAKNLFGNALNSPLVVQNGFSILSGTFLTLSVVSFKKIYEGVQTSIRMKIEGDEVRMERDAKVERYLREIEGKISKERIMEIVTLDASTLLKKIRAKEISVVDAYLAYSYRSATIGKEYGWITDVDFENGLKQAKEYQKMIDEGRTEEIEKFPLFGLPISVKDEMAVKGMVTTVGYTTLGKNVCQEDSFIVNVMRRKGAIPFVHSNVPQGLMAMDSSNFLWGKCENPWSRKKIVGGSSGGEAGLIISRCSAVGLGSDIGGSIRIPSALTGLYGFKPTSSRISKLGGCTYTGTNHLGFLNFAASYGPMCKSADDVILMARNLFGEFGDDFSVNNKPFSNRLFNLQPNHSDVKIGYFYETTFTESAHSLQQAVKEVVELLTKQGYKCVEFPIQKFNALLELGFSLLLNSGLAEIIPTVMKGEPIYYYYQKMMFLWKLPRWMISILSNVAFLFGEKRAAHFLHDFKKLDRLEFIEASRRFIELKFEFLNYWKNEGFTALISPVLPVNSISHGNAGDFVHFNQFNFICNMVDLPSCTIPLRLNDDTSFSSRYKDRFAKLFEAETKESAGMPLGIQLIGFPMMDEVILRLMKEISSNYEFERKCGDKVFEVIEKEGNKAEDPVADLLTNMKEMIFPTSS